MADLTLDNIDEAMDRARSMLPDDISDEDIKSYNANHPGDLTERQQYLMLFLQHGNLALEQSAKAEDIRDTSGSINWENLMNAVTSLLSGDWDGFKKAISNLRHVEVDPGLYQRMEGRAEISLQHAERAWEGAESATVSQQQKPQAGVSAQPDDSAPAAAITRGSATQGYSSFDDFVQQNHYEYAAKLEDTIGQEEIDARPGLDEDHILTLYAAKHIDDLDVDSVAINQTLNTAVVALAEMDENDPNAGQMHYVAFVKSGENSRTYLFTENITINPDGSIDSQMEEGKVWSTNASGDLDEQQAYGRLIEKFGQHAGSPGVESSFEEYARTHDVAIGGVQNHGGHYEISHGADTAAISSASELNGTTGIEVTSEYSRSGQGQMLMKIFRENAEGVSEVSQGTAPNVESPAKYNQFSQMQPGIGTLDP